MRKGGTNRTLRSVALAGIALVSVVVGSCRAPQSDAEALSRETLAEVVAYDAALRKTSNNLFDYYSKTLNDLRREFTAFSNLADRSEMSRQSREAADDMIADGFSDARFHEFVDNGVRRSQSEVELEISKLLADVGRSVSKLDLQEKKVKELRASLENLQSEQTAAEILKDLGPIIKKIQELELEEQES